MKSRVTGVGMCTLSELEWISCFLESSEGFVLLAKRMQHAHTG